MSADNGIYVAHFSDGYRVAEISAIDNLGFYANRSRKELVEYIEDCFKFSIVFSTFAAAMCEAHAMASECPVLEYGVSYLGELVGFSNSQTTGRGKK